MPTPTAIMEMSASLLNDTARTVYTDSALLPYLNMALDELQEYFEQANIPSTNEKSAVIAVPANTSIISFTSSPALPADLIDIQRLWERIAGTPPYIPVVRKEFIPSSHEDQSITQFLFFAWMDQEIHLIPSTVAIDLKIDYIKNIFATPIDIADVGTSLTTINIKQFLGYKTAALAAMFVMENESRATALQNEAIRALDRELGIPIKGRQSITTRRQPFMGSYRRRVYV